MSESRKKMLSQLKYPLVFFGFWLSVVEATFGVAIIKNSESIEAIWILASWMGFLFLVSILVVAFLVYKVPTHVMLESQRELKAYPKIKDEVNAATLEQYEKKIKSAQDKEVEALRIIGDLQKDKSELLLKLISLNSADLDDIAPSGGEAFTCLDNDSVIWRLKFSNGETLKFKIPTKHENL